LTAERENIHSIHSFIHSFILTTVPPSLPVNELFSNPRHGVPHLPRTLPRGRRHLPFVLICGHSFCRADVNKLSLNGTQNFPCPICKCLVNLDYYENRFPPKNFALIEQLKHLTSSQPAKAPVPSGSERGPEPGLCGECNDNKSSVFCQECQIDFCVGCNELVHKHRVFLTHSRIPIENKPPPQPLLPMCPLHPDEKLKLFCDEEKCQTAICLMCAICGGRRWRGWFARSELTWLL
jgi:hypothetical protein